MASISQAVGVNESANNTETVIATLTGIIPEVPSQTINLSFLCSITLGLTSTGGTFRFRRSGLTGTQVGPSLSYPNLTTAAGTTDASGAAVDTPGEGNFTYVLTYQGTGDTGVATVNSSTLSANWE